MTRTVDMIEFANTWICDILRMDKLILEENKDRVRGCKVPNPNLQGTKFTSQSFQGSSHRKIPIGFLKYLKGHDHIEHVVLKRAGNKWLVKMNRRRLEDGWEKFAEEHDLQLGDMLIFRHEGDMEFDVSIFDSTHCDTKYAEYMQILEEKDKKVEDKNEDDEVVEDENDEEDEDDEAYTHDKPFGQSHFEFTIRQYCLSKGKTFSNVEAVKDANLSHSHFICTIKPYCLSKHFVCIPKQFAQENRLYDRKWEIIVRDEQRSWTFNVYTCNKITYFGRGWHEFCLTNCLKEGDRLMFEIVSNGELPIFRFHGKESPSLKPEFKKEKLDAERMSDKPITDLSLKTSGTFNLKSQVAASTSADANLHFISIIKPYAIRNPVLYLPMDFAKSNGLMDKHEMIIVDEKRRSWSVWIGRIDEFHFGIKRGWTQFRKENGVQVGDTYRFELTNNGTIPVVHFHFLLLILIAGWLHHFSLVDIIGNALRQLKFVWIECLT
ncbi:hypothetical protein T459_03694 [Capsicum annuum]|uniref:TF-B3 domain-containing protein n=1 Tax=Capsicum annuum TaxID=4072 RepID=A0A2G3ANK2_CAPAN|nr:hypothetical protein T459_03694 [Capsicum annuum]